MESLYIKKPIYPLISFFSSIFIFFYGLSISNSISIVYFFCGLSIIYVFFGYTYAMIRGLLIFAFLGFLVALGTYISGHSILASLQTFARILLLSYSSIIMIALPPINLSRNLSQLRFPRILTLGMLITIRFIPLLIEEGISIKQAMKTRGGRDSLFNPSIIYRAFFLPFIVRLISISDIMSISLETRGFSTDEKNYTIYKPTYFSLKDALFLLLLTILFLGVYKLG